MKRLVPILAAVAIITEGCTMYPYDGEEISDPTDFAPWGYALYPDQHVQMFLVNPDLGPKSDFASNYVSGNGFGVYSATTAAGTLDGVTGYLWQFPDSGFDLTSAWYSDTVACINPGVTEEAHTYMKTVFGTGTASSAGGYVSNSDPTSCWSANGSDWDGYTANCLRDESPTDVVEFFYDYDDCDSMTPPNFTCTSLSGVTVCFPNRHPGGSNQNLKVFISGASSSLYPCVSDGGSSCSGIGFYQDCPLWETYCGTAESALYTCSNEGGGDYVCTVQVPDEDQFGVYVSGGGDFSSPPY